MLQELGALATIFSAVVAVIALLYTRVLAILGNLTTRDAFVEWLENPKLDIWYRKGLSVGLRWCDLFFGKTLLQSFNKCVAIALVYVALLYLLAWTFGASVSIGQLPYFPILHPIHRVVVAVSLVGLGVWCFVVTRYETAAINSIKPHIQRFGFPAFDLFPRLLLISSIVLLTIFVGVLGGGAGAVAVTVAVILAGYKMPSAIVALCGALSGGYVSLVLGYSYGEQGSAVLGAQAPGMAVGLVTVWFVLPMLNGLVDSVSWATSRWLVSRIVTTKYRVILSMHVFADAMLAIGFLFLMAVLMTVAFQANNLFVKYFRSPDVISIEPILVAAFTNPWPHGLWIISMLLTTLVPTLLHLSVALGGMLMIATPPWLRAKVIKTLKATYSPGIYRELAAGYVVIIGFSGVVITSICFFVVVWAFGYALKPTSEALLELTMWIVRNSGSGL